MKKKRIIATAILLLVISGYLLIYCFWALQIQRTPSLKVWLPLDQVPCIFVSIVVFSAYCLTIIDFSSKKGILKDEQDLCQKENACFVILSIAEPVVLCSEVSFYRLYYLQEIDKKNRMRKEKTWYELPSMIFFQDPQLKTLYEVSVFRPDNGRPSAQMREIQNKIIY